MDRVSASLVEGTPPSSLGARPQRFKPYPAYKDSGVEWLGEIPAHWSAVPLKRVGNLQAGAGFPDNEQGLQDEELPFFKVGDMATPGNEREMLVHQHTVSYATARRLRAFVFPGGSVVFAKVGAALLLNRRRLITRPSCIDNNMMGFTPGACDPTWAMYWLSGLDLGELANPGAVPSVNEGQMRDTPAAVPPPPEQRAIAAFLDRETARIDALVAKKERLIELLQEKRTAVISAVVNGKMQVVRDGGNHKDEVGRMKDEEPGSSFRLQPSSFPMKDSGVEWLGEVPAHWSAVPLKRVSDLQAGAGFPDDEQGIQDEELPFFKVGDMGTPGNEREMLVHQHTVSYGTARRLRAFVFPPSTVVFAKVGAALLLNRRRLLARPSCIDNNMMGLIPQACDPTWAMYWLSGLDLAELANPGAIPSVNEGQMRDTPAAVPPLPEQRAIAAFLDQETAKLDALVAKVREAIERLKEYRTALISVAVTGKIDVSEG